MNKKPKQAWDLYHNRDNSTESFNLLQLIANDCYKVRITLQCFVLMVAKMGQFLYAAKAFDALQKIDQNPEYWEGKRGAAAGVLQMVIAGKEAKYWIL